MKRGLLFAATIASLSTGTGAGAQGLSGKVGELIKFGSCDQALCLVTGPGSHGAHYLLSAQNAGAELLAFLTGSITASVSSLPIGSTSGGMTFSFEGGAPVANRTSAGPIFAERASTLGKGRVLAGVNTTGISFSKLRGVETDNIKVNLTHEDVGASGLGDIAFEDDVIGVALDLKLRLQVTTLFATYGVSDRLDIGVALPLVMSSLDGTGSGTISNPTGSVSGVHFFGDAGSPSLTANSSAKGSATGLGDIAVRAKLHLAGSNSRGLALLADVRLPTGDENNFSGAGKLSASGILVASTTRGNFSPHANLGYALRTADGQSNAILATVGFDQMLKKSATLAIDLISQMQSGSGGGALPASVTVAGTSIEGTNIPDKKDNPVGLSIGGRFLAGNFTVLANGLIPVSSGGLQSKFMWTLGIERSF